MCKQRFYPFLRGLRASHDLAPFLPEEYRPLVFDTKTPHSVNTFLVDGAVAGTWRVERTTRSATLTLTPFAPLPVRAGRELDGEARRLVRFLEPEAAAHRIQRRQA